MKEKTTGNLPWPDSVRVWSDKGIASCGYCGERFVDGAAIRSAGSGWAHVACVGPSSTHVRADALDEAAGVVQRVAELERSTRGYNGGNWPENAAEAIRALKTAPAASIESGASKLNHEREAELRRIATRAKLSDAWADEVIASGITAAELRHQCGMAMSGCGETKLPPLAPTITTGRGEDGT